MKITKLKLFIFNFVNRGKLPKSTCEYTRCITMFMILFPIMIINYMWYRFGLKIINKIKNDIIHEVLIFDVGEKYSIIENIFYQFVALFVCSIFISIYFSTYFILLSILSFILVTPIAYMISRVFLLFVMFLYAFFRIINEKIAYSKTFKIINVKKYCKEINWKK